MKSLFLIIVAYIMLAESALAYVPDQLILGESRNSNIISSDGVTFIGVLTLIQSILLKGVLPVVVI
jgi:hypothetical protein